MVVSWTRAARCGRVFSRFGCVLRDDRTEAARRRAKSLKAVAAPPTSSEVVGSAKRTDDGATERRSKRQQVAVSDARRTLRFGGRDALARARARAQARDADAATPSRPSPSQVALSPSRWPLNVYRFVKAMWSALRAVTVVLRRRQLARRAVMAWPRPLQRALGPVALLKVCREVAAIRIRCTLFAALRPEPAPRRLVALHECRVRCWALISSGVARSKRSASDCRR